MASIGSASLQIIPSFDGLQGHLDRGTSGPLSRAGAAGGLRFGDEAGKSAGRRFGGVFSAAAKASLVGAFGAGALAFKIGADSIEAASTLNESLNAVNVTYGKQAKEVKKLGRESADALGLSNSEFNGLAVQFSAFAETIGRDGQGTVSVLDDLTTRGADFASVMDLEVNEALGLFQSGLAGETEPLRRFGIDLSAAAVESYALAEGIQQQGTEFTEAEKVQARYGLLMDKTAKTQGDFANTSDSLANRQRILNARWDDAKAKLGTALLPLMEDLTGFIIDKGIPAFEDFSAFLIDDAAPAVKGLYDNLKPVGGAIKDVVGFLNDLPSEAKLAALGAALGGGAFLKMRGGRGGLLGAAGSALGLAKPVPVFVTNQGFGGVGDGIGGGKAGSAGGGAKGALLGLGFAGFAGLGTQLSNSFLEKQVGTDNAVNIAAAKGSPGGGLGSPFSSDDMDGEVEKIESAFGSLVASATTSSAQVVAAFATLPKQVRTDMVLNGVPESMRQAKELVAQYDLTPKEKRTLFELLGYEQTVARARNINRELDYAARDRRTQITVDYANRGYDTAGGIQSGAADTYSSQRNFDKATGRMGP